MVVAMAEVEKVEVREEVVMGAGMAVVVMEVGTAAATVVEAMVVG